MSNIREFKYDIGHLNVGRFQGIILRKFREDGLKKYEYQCDICGYVGIKPEWSLIKGNGCPCCCNQIVVKGINDIPTTDPWMVGFFQGGYEEASQYTKSSGKRIIPKCPDCGRIKDRSVTINNLYKTHGISCVCKDGISFANKFIFGLMEQLLEHDEIKSFQREFHLYNKIYDMQFISNNDIQYLIEMDGGLNHGQVISKHPNKNEKFKFVSCKLFVNDMVKDQIAENFNYKLIRIDCYKTDFEYIRTNILNSELADVVNLSMVNWKTVRELCSTNLLKAVCDYKQEHHEISTKECAEIFNISDTTVREYWKYGSKLGWCTYNPKIEPKMIINKKEYFYNANPIIVEDLTTNTTIRFRSETAFSQASKELLGINITREKIHKELLNTDILTKYTGFKIYKEKKEII